MAAPVAKFSFSAVALNFQFQDLSTNVPTSWSWNFGDSNTSTVQNPSHVYATAGRYVVTLTATNADGSDIYTYEVIASDALGLAVPIREMIDGYLPAGYSIDENVKLASIRKWQLYVGPVLDPAIVGNDILDETKYPGLANALIASLVTWDFMVNQMGGNILAGGSASSSSSSTTTPSSGSGNIKSIETGPTKVEYYDSKDSVAKTQESNAQMVKSVQYYEQLKGTVCTFANRLGVILPAICDYVRKKPIVYKKAKIQ